MVVAVCTAKGLSGESTSTVRNYRTAPMWSGVPLVRRVVWGHPSSGQDQRSILRDNHRMLELSNKAPVSGSKRPSVCIVNDMICGDGQEGLDSEDQAFAKNHLLAVIEARD